MRPRGWTSTFHRMRNPNLKTVVTLVKVMRFFAPKGTSTKGSLGEVVAGAKAMGRLLPRNPIYARMAAPFLPPGLLRGALTAYGRPKQFAATVALVGGVSILDVLQTRRGR